MALLHELAQDARYALRFLRRAPGFSLATISMLTFGIGLVAGGYSVVNGLFLRPWPVHDSDEVVVASAERRGQPAAGRIDDGFSFGAYEHIRAHARAADYVAMERNYLSVAAQRGERLPGRVPEALFASDNFVEMLGIQLQQGTGLANDPASGPKAATFRRAVAPSVPCGTGNRRPHHLAGTRATGDGRRHHGAGIRQSWH